MKRYCYVILCCLFLSTSIFAQDDRVREVPDRTLTNGFSIQFEFGSASPAYGIGDNLFGLIEFNRGVVFGLQIGNRWYVHKEEQFGIGVMVNWFDFTVGANISKESAFGSSGDIVKATIDFSILEVGPVATFKLNERGAIDGYYNIRPTLMASVAADGDGDGFSTAGFGLTHAIGFAYRAKAFYVGPEFGFGKIKDREVRDSDDFDQTYFETDISARNFKILIGFKF